MFQYAWEGGEPALWDTSKKMRELGTDWNKIVDWSWQNFMKGSMENTHEVLMTAMRHKDCVQIKFEDFTVDYDAAFKRWMDIWEINPEAIPALLETVARHDLNRLTAEQRAQHHHVSGNSFSKVEAKAVESAIRAHKELSEMVKMHQTELNYSEV